MSDLVPSDPLLRLGAIPYFKQAMNTSLARLPGGYQDWLGVNVDNETLEEKLAEFDKIIANMEKLSSYLKRHLMITQRKYTEYRDRMNRKLGQAVEILESINKWDYTTGR